MLADHLHLWHINLVPFFDFDPNNALLSNDEQQRTDRFYFDKHRIRFSTCRKLLRLILANYLKISNDLLDFSVEKNGKPYLNDYPIHFNLSNSGDFMLLGVTQNLALGVDIEQVKQRDFLGLAKHSFSDTEYQEVFNASEEQRQTIFYKIWCQKEAFIKHNGLGLSYPLKDFSVSSLGQGGLIQVSVEDHTNYLMETFQLDKRIQAAFCLKTDTIKPVFFEQPALEKLIYEQA